MNAKEVGRLLGLMALADNRKPPEGDDARKAMITFWLGMVGDLSYADAVQAVQAHYRESREWCMPADIRERVAAVHNARLAAAGDIDIPEHLADKPAEARDWLQRTKDAIASGAAPQRAIGRPQ